MDVTEREGGSKLSSRRYPFSFRLTPPSPFLHFLQPIIFFCCFSFVPFIITRDSLLTPSKHMHYASCHYNPPMSIILPDSPVLSGNMILLSTLFSALLTPYHDYAPPNLPPLCPFTQFFPFFLFLSFASLPLLTVLTSLPPHPFSPFRSPPFPVLRQSHPSFLVPSSIVTKRDFFAQHRPPTLSHLHLHVRPPLATPFIHPSKHPHSNDLFPLPYFHSLLIFSLSFSLLFSSLHLLTTPFHPRSSPKLRTYDHPFTMSLVVLSPCINKCVFVLLIIFSFSSPFIFPLRSPSPFPTGTVTYNYQQDF